MLIPTRTARRLLVVGITGVLALGLMSPAVAGASTPTATRESTGDTVNLCKHTRAIKGELRTVQAWLDQVAELAPAEWDVYLDRAQARLDRVKRRLVAAVRNGHCRVSVERLCNHTDEGRLVVRKLNALLQAGIDNSSGELQDLLERGQAHLHKVAKYLGRLAAAHCD